MITVHTLASGSEGNCLVIDAEGTRILVDAGISTRRIKTTLEQLGIALAQVDAILITHEHSDHISGLQTLVKHHRIPIYASPATACQLAWRIAGIGPMLREVQRLTPFTVGAARITPFETSHDAAGSIDYRIDAAGGSVGILTDTGRSRTRPRTCSPGRRFSCSRATTTRNVCAPGPTPIRSSSGFSARWGTCRTMPRRPSPRRWRVSARARLSSRTLAGKTTPPPWRSSASGAH